MTDIDSLLAFAKAAKERADAATPGPWEADITDGISQHWSVKNGAGVVALSGHDSHGGCTHSLTYLAADAEFIASSRIDLPILADGVIELAEENRQLRNMALATNRLAAELAAELTTLCKDNKLHADQVEQLAKEAVELTS
jgi:hypothetical protein